jgi:hypothetical protein
MKSTMIFIISLLAHTTTSWSLSPDLFSNWENPTIEDLQIAQSFLEEQAAEVNQSKYAHRVANLQAFQVFHPFCTNYDLQIDKGEDSSICVICYISFSEAYHTMLKRLLSSLRSQGFNGDILYRIGGWPNLQNGGILLCDVPYAFKISAFEEAMHLGYTSALWLDARVVPLQNLNSVFNKIRKDDVYFRKSHFPFSKIPTVTSSLAEALKLSLADLWKVQHYATGVLGLNLKNPDVQNLLADWHNYAKNKIIFQSSFPEQVSFSVLIEKYHLQRGVCDLPEIVFGKSYIRPNTQFLIEY